MLFAVQMLSGRKRLWMPGWVARRGVAAARMKRMVAGARPMAARMDHWFHGRLRWLTSGLGIRLAARGPVHTNFGDRVARPGGGMQGARVQQGRYLASAGNAADSPQAGQPEGKALVCIALACMVPPLEMIPSAASAPMGAIALIGLALLVRDGALMVVASLLACGAAGLLITHLL